MSPQKQMASGRQGSKRIWIGFGVCFALGVLATLLGETLAASFRGKDAGRVAPAPAPASSLASLRQTGSKGPWGNLEYKRIPLENCEQQFSNEPCGSSPQRWVFENLSQQQLAELFNSSGLTEVKRPSSWTRGGGRWW